MTNARQRPKMNREDRAKQFMPFAALKGYEEALRAREHIVVERSSLSEERLNELDEIFRTLKNRDIVTVVYYSVRDENYLKLTGMISRIDVDSRILKVVNKSISFEDIRDISVQEACD